MRRILRGIVVASVVGLGAASAADAAWAEDAGPDVARMRSTPSYVKSILDAAYATPGWTKAGCPRARATLGDEIGLVEGPIRIDGRGRPTAGAWIEHVALTGCAGQRQLNVLAFVQTPGALTSVPLLPGTTRTDPLLQKDGTEYAMRYASIVEPQVCAGGFVADTDYLGPQPGPPPVPGKPAWHERWTVEHCGKRVEMEMRFTPDSTGTSIGVGAVAQKP